MSPLLSVREFGQKHSTFSQATLRHLIFYSEPRKGARGHEIPGNGMKEAGAILRVGSKVLLHEQRFFNWIDRSNGFSNNNKK